MSDYNDQIFQLWAQGQLDEGDAVSTGDKWNVFYTLDKAMTQLVKSVDARATSARTAAADADSFTQRVAGVVTVIAVLLGLLVAFVVSRGIVRGIQGVRGGLERLAGGDLAVRLPVRGRDEVGQMAVALNSAATTMASTVAEIAASADAVAAVVGGAVGVVGADLGVGGGDLGAVGCGVRCRRGGVAQRADRRRRRGADGCLDPGDRLERRGGQRGGRARGRPRRRRRPRPWRSWATRRPRSATSSR